MFVVRITYKGVFPGTAKIKANATRVAMEQLRRIPL